MYPALTVTGGPTLPAASIAERHRVAGHRFTVAARDSPSASRGFDSHGSVSWGFQSGGSGPIPDRLLVVAATGTEPVADHDESDQGEHDYGSTTSIPSHGTSRLRGVRRHPVRLAELGISKQDGPFRAEDFWAKWHFNAAICVNLEHDDV